VARHLGQSLVVENRGGASGSVGTAYLRNQRGDGSVIAGVTEAVFRIAMVQPVDCDALADFTYLGGTNALVWSRSVRRDSPARDLRDLVERARVRPEAVSYATGGTAANPLLGMRVVEHRTGTRFLFVPLASCGDMINAVVAGTVDVMFDSLGAVAGMMEGGAMRLLAVAAAERIPRFAGIPTAREQGLDVLHSLPTGFIAPRELPPPVRRAYEHSILQAAGGPEHDRLLARPNLTPWRRNGAEYEAHVREVFQTLPPLLSELGMLRG